MPTVGCHRLKRVVQSLLKESVAATFPDAPSPHVERTRDPAHGDFASNIAMQLAGVYKDHPRAIAERIRAALTTHAAIERVEIAGPGFLNFFVAEAAFRDTVDAILDAGSAYGRSEVGAGQRVLVEFVSANPTGPLHVGHGRGAAYGDCLARLLSAAGYCVDREYYVNDAGRQMDILAVSVYLRYLEAGGAAMTLPRAAYRGDYVRAAGRALRDRHGARLEPASDVLATGAADAGSDPDAEIDALIGRVRAEIGAEAFADIRKQILDSQLAAIDNDLTHFGVAFDRWTRESELIAAGAVARALERLAAAGHTYESGGALWFTAAHFGDDKDRVLRRSDGSTTYFAADVAYHVDKIDRGYDRLIDVLGADHHGYVARVRAAVDALTGKPDHLAIALVQFAILYRGAERVPMSTRAGSYVTLAELCAEVGVDAARFFYVMRAHEQHLDFDLELAQSRSNDNPVYYIQYAHARICSVERQLAERGGTFERQRVALSRLTTEHEQRLLRVLSRFDEVVVDAATAGAVQAVVHYLREAADAFHSYYNADAFIVDDAELRNARLALIFATRQVLANGLELLGVSAPERM